MKSKISAFVAFMSMRKALRKLSNKQLNDMYLYYLRNKPVTLLQKYEYNLIRGVVNERAKVC